MASKVGISSDDYERHHRERYAKVMRREMTLIDALRENANDWDAVMLRMSSIDSTS